MGARKNKRLPYKYKGSHSVVRDFHEFSGIPIDIIELNIQNHRALIRDEWNNTESNFKERDFYAKSRYYVYDLLSANHNWMIYIKKLHSTFPSMFPILYNHPGKKFLEFGGGLGLFCEMMCYKGKDVTYLDIPGQIYNFAAWRFKKYNLPIKTICADPAGFKLDDQYDIIYSDAVLEHVKDPAAAVENLCLHTAKDGVIIHHIDLHGNTPDMPMHKDINVKQLHAIIEKLGFANMTGKNKSFSIWRKK